MEVAHFTGSDLPAPWGSNGATTGASTVSYAPDAATNTDCATASDEAGVLTKPCFDSVGRLTQAVEAGISATTTYGYDSLDNLTSVRQQGTDRAFEFSSVKRLITASNPETGTIRYTYDANGNLRTRKDARNVTTTYHYDSLNQIKSKTSDDSPQTPAVSYEYDHSWLTAVKAGSAFAYNYTAWDGLGRFTGANQVIGGQSYAFMLAHKPVVCIDWIQYPNSQRRITTGYDSAGRAARLSGSILTNAPTNYVSASTFQPHGAILSRTLGNGVVATRSDNSRLQPTNLQIGSLLRLDYNYGTTANNGNLPSQTITRGGQIWTQTYSYAEPGGGSVNRLTSASESGAGSWSQSLCYDKLGSRWLLSSTGLLTPTYDTPQGPDCSTPPFKL